MRVPFNDSIQAWSVGVDGLPKCCAMATMAMNWRVPVAIIWEPLSDTASRIGLTPSSVFGSTRPLAARSRAASSRPSDSNAIVKPAWTWVVVSSLDTRWVSHLRDTRSSMISTFAPQRVKWVVS